LFEGPELIFATLTREALLSCAGNRPTITWESSRSQVYGQGYPLELIIIIIIIIIMLLFRSIHFLFIQMPVNSEVVNNRNSTAGERR